MNGKIIISALFLLFGGAFSIAASSMAIECYNLKETEKFKGEKATNFTFLIVNLVSAIVLVLCGFVGFYLGFKEKSFNDME